jgi:UDP-2-acetamido-3-amino-2,3-dideoxy-glucuronate N-acetyltransferase
MIHATSDVQSDKIGEGTRIWQFCVVMRGAIIGKNCNICAHVLIENDVVVGDNVTIKSGVQLWDGVRVEEGVFIGPNVTFTNDVVPRSKKYSDKYMATLIEKGASVGANSTIVAGHVIGAYSFVGAGSVVTKDIPPHTVWYGNPAKHRGYITRGGCLLDLDMKDNLGEKKSLED